MSDPVRDRDPAGRARNARPRDEAGRPLSWVGQFQDVTARRSQEAELRHLADHDPLTGLLNRRSFERALEGLGSFGSAAADVVRTRVYLTPDADWREAVRAYHELFEGVNPTNTTLFVAGLIPEGALVEVELDAWIERGEALA